MEEKEEEKEEEEEEEEELNSRKENLPAVPVREQT